MSNADHQVTNQDTHLQRGLVPYFYVYFYPVHPVPAPLGIKCTLRGNTHTRGGGVGPVNGSGVSNLSSSAIFFFFFFFLHPVCPTLNPSIHMVMSSVSLSGGPVLSRFQQQPQWQGRGFVYFFQEFSVRHVRWATANRNNRWWCPLSTRLHSVSTTKDTGQGFGPTLFNAAHENRG